MSVYREFVCITCRENHTIPRLGSDDPNNRYKEQDAYFDKLKAEHEAKGCITDSYNDVAPSYREGDDLILDSSCTYDDKPHVWIKDYYLFKHIPYKP